MQLYKTTDYAVIQHLAKAIWQDHYVPMVGQAQVDYMLGRFYAPEALAQQAAEGQQFWLISQDDLPCGYIGISEKSTGEYFLNKFYLATSLQGKGIGEKVFNTLLSNYNNLKTIRLQVNINNYKTINFYFKVGFKIEKRFILDIGEGFVMDDFIMIKK
jgi:diamine N-acetyltransferase